MESFNEYYSKMQNRREPNIYKLVCGGLLIVCGVLIAMVYVQHEHIRYLEGMANKYFMK